MAFLISKLWAFVYINLLVGLLVKLSRSHFSCGYEPGVSLPIAQAMRCYAVTYAATSLIARLCCNATVAVAAPRAGKASLRPEQKPRYGVSRIQGIERAHSVKALHLVGIRPERLEVVLRRHTPRKPCIEQAVLGSPASSRQLAVYLATTHAVMRSFGQTIRRLLRSCDHWSHAPIVER